MRHFSYRVTGVIVHRWVYRVIGTLLIGLGVLTLADWDLVGVVGGLATVVIGVAGWEASFR